MKPVSVLLTIKTIAGVCARTMLFTTVWWATFAVAQESVVEAIKNGQANVVLMRHALAPGTGDPFNFTLVQCDTQRNLNDVGRQQAVDTGDFFRTHGIEFAGVYTSQWCRCVETAQLLNMASGVDELPVINSFFQQMHKADDQTSALKRWLAGQADQSAVLLVTHQVNITAYTGVYPQSGELVVGNVDGGGEFTLLGRIDPR
ncbi:MAG: histidine phosphatase family protein [Pseudomonadota bacterium]